MVNENHGELYLYTFRCECVMGHEVGPYLGLNEIGSPIPMINFITNSYLFNLFLDLSVMIFGFIY